MQVKNMVNRTIKITASYDEVAKIVTALNEYNAIKHDEELSKLAYELMNPKVNGGK